MTDTQLPESPNHDGDHDHYYTYTDDADDIENQYHLDHGGEGYHNGANHNHDRRLDYSHYGFAYYDHNQAKRFAAYDSAADDLFPPNWDR